jgi:hypothetical protein
MSNNCVSYGNSSLPLAKIRMRLGSPMNSMSFKSKSDVLAKDCITCKDKVCNILACKSIITTNKRTI